MQFPQWPAQPWLWNTVKADQPTSTYSGSRYEYYDDVGLGLTGRLGVRLLRDSFFQPFLELEGTGVLATRTETFGGLRFGLIAAF